MKPIKQYMQFVKPYKWLIFWTIIIGVAKFAIPLLIPLILGYVIDHIINGNLTQTEKTNQLLLLMGIIFSIFVISSVSFLPFSIRSFKNVGTSSSDTLYFSIICAKRFNSFSLL